MKKFERSTRSLVAPAAVFGAAVILLVASACGESKSQQDASRYADSLCTSVSGWETHITGIVSRLDTGSPAAVTRAKLNEAAASTVGLLNQIHTLAVPSVDGADEAKQSVDRFVGDSQATVTDVKAGARQIQAYGTGAQNVAGVAVPLGLQLGHLVTEGRTTVGDLEAIKGPFQHAVKKSKACQALKPSDNEQ
jgi:hypothetical protein